VHSVRGSVARSATATRETGSKDTCLGSMTFCAKPSRDQLPKHSVARPTAGIFCSSIFLNMQLARISCIARRPILLVSSKFALSRTRVRWASGTRKRDPILGQSVQLDPDGMAGIADKMDDLQKSLVYSSIKIGDLLQAKGEELGGTARLPVVFVYEDNTVFEAIKVMTENRIGAVMVRPKGAPSDSPFIGILTERDYMTKIALRGLNSRSTKVDQIMTRNPITVKVDETCLIALKRMTKGQFRHIPVVQHGKIVGILSLGDLVKSLLSSFKDSVDYLSEYIGGTGVAGKDKNLLDSAHHKSGSN